MSEIDLSNCKSIKASLFSEKVDGFFVKQFVESLSLRQ